MRSSLLLAALALLPGFALAQSPTLAPRAAVPAPSGLVLGSADSVTVLHNGVATTTLLPSLGAFLGGAAPVTVTVTISGAITVPAASSVLVLVNSTTSSPIVLTLAAGAYDRQEFEFKRIGSGPFTLKASLDGLTGTSSFTSGSGTVLPLDDLAVRWAAGPATYLMH